MEHYILDRFEGGLAVLEAPDGSFVQVARSQLAPDAREGDLLLRQSGCFAPDAAATKARRERLKARFALPGGR